MPIEDRETFDAEALASRPELWRYANRLAGNAPDAEDLVQETLLRALMAWRSYRPGTHMTRWLRTILYRVFATEYRRRRRTPCSLTTLSGEERAGLTPIDPPAALDQTFLRDEVELALNQLPPEQREAVRLRDFEGYSGEETAALLRVAPGTVKSRVFRAREQLRARLSQVAADPGGRLPATAEAA